MEHEWEESAQNTATSASGVDCVKDEGRVTGRPTEELSKYTSFHPRACRTDPVLSSSME